MPDSGTLAWVELLVLLVDGPRPEPAVRGAIRSTPDDESQYVGWSAYGGQPCPVMAAARRSPDVDFAAPIRVWRDGAKVRIEEPDGSPNLIVGETTCWRFDADHETPLESPAGAVHFGGNGTDLLTRREAQDFLGNDFTRPTGPVVATTFLGRRAWAVELAPPPHKPHPLQLVVDAETGLVLQQRNDGFGTVSEWVEFVVGESFDPALFTWHGDARSYLEQHAESEARHERDMSARRRWFTDNVAALPLALELAVEIGVHVYDDATGAFEGSFDHGSGSIARRPRSDEPWQLNWQEAQHRWSTERWDWAVSVYNTELTPAGLVRLKAQLDAGPPR